MPKGGYALENEIEFKFREGVNEETTPVTALRTIVTITTAILCKYK